MLVILFFLGFDVVSERYIQRKMSFLMDNCVSENDYAMIMPTAVG